MSAAGITVRTVEVERPPLYVATCDDCGWQSALVDSEWVAGQLVDLHLEWHDREPS